MNTSIFRQLHRSKLYTTGLQCCSKKLHRISSQSPVLQRSHKFHRISFQSPRWRKFGGIQYLQNRSLQNSADSEQEVDDVLQATPLDYDSTNPLDYDDYFNVKDLVNMKELFDARVHLGHHEGAWNPATKPYIYRQRSTQHIIDLNQTVDCLKVALNVLSHVTYRDGIILFLTTNPRYDYLLQKAARSSGEYFISREWEKGIFLNQHAMLHAPRLPDLVIAFNCSRFERIREAMVELSRMNIPIIGLVDTDVDPRLITYPVPGNDDTIDSVSKFCDIFATAIINAKERRKKDEERNRRRIQAIKDANRENTVGNSC